MKPAPHCSALPKSLPQSVSRSPRLYSLQRMSAVAGPPDKISRMRDRICVASRECPPNSKKLSLTPMGRVPKRCSQIWVIFFSTSVSGAVKSVEMLGRFSGPLGDGAASTAASSVESCSAFTSCCALDLCKEMSRSTGITTTCETGWANTRLKASAPSVEWIDLLNNSFLMPLSSIRNDCVYCHAHILPGIPVN